MKKSIQKLLTKIFYEYFVYNTKNLIKEKIKK